MSRKHDVSSIRTDRAYLYLTVDGKRYRIPWGDCSPRLVQASYLERRRVEVSPSGYGLRWPLIDEDLAIEPLIAGAEEILTETA